MVVVKELNVGKNENSNEQGRSSNNNNNKEEMKELVDMLSNLNPLAREFVPPSLLNLIPYNPNFTTSYPPFSLPPPPPPNFTQPQHPFSFPPHHPRPRPHPTARNRKFPNSNAPPKQPRRPNNNRTGFAQRDQVIRRTVYVSDIDHQVTEEQLASLFVNCGHVVDCRICGDPNSVLRFAFIEFTNEHAARAALALSGTILGFYPVKVLPSKTAIAPVNPTFLPQTEDEREMCARTVYCTNIDKKVSHEELALFFQSACGEVHRLRLLGDQKHNSRIAFVEFVMAESATAALNCSGIVLGSSAIRVSPSKTPVRPRSPRQAMH